MSTKKTVALAFPFTLFTLTACERMQSRNVEEVRKDSVNNQVELEKQKSALDQNQAEKRAELARIQSDQQAKLQAEKLEDRAEAANDMAHAQADLREAREEVAAKNAKRVNEADARATELYAKAKGLSPRKRGKFDAAWNVYKDTRHEVTNAVVRLQESSSTDSAQLKSETEQVIARLEVSVEGVQRAL
jgi:hypothetical protein